MKILVSALVFLSANFAAANCTQLEAQMIAKVRSVSADANGLCRVQLDWSSKWMFNSSYQCPLDIDEASSAGVLTSCNKKVGEEISGIVYRSVNEGPDSIYLY